MPEPTPSTPNTPSAPAPTPASVPTPVPTDQLHFALPPQHATVEEERRHRKERLAAALRLFGRFGFEEGVAGHITARDPEFTDCFWVNPFGMSFKHITVGDLILVNHEGKVVEGRYHVNQAAFAIHAQVHRARPDVVAAAHSHSVYGRALSTLGELLDPITQDVCAFYEDHASFPKSSTRSCRSGACALWRVERWTTFWTPGSLSRWRRLPGSRMNSFESWHATWASTWTADTSNRHEQGPRKSGAFCLPQQRGETAPR
ncbi:class II aldolase/adducin family protein [Streptomyces chrestomyceticus]